MERESSYVDVSTRQRDQVRGVTHDPNCGMEDHLASLNLSPLPDKGQNAYFVAMPGTSGRITPHRKHTQTQLPTKTGEKNKKKGTHTRVLRHKRTTVSILRSRCNYHLTDPNIPPKPEISRSNRLPEAKESFRPATDSCEIWNS